MTPIVIKFYKRMLLRAERGGLNLSRAERRHVAEYALLCADKYMRWYK